MNKKIKIGIIAVVIIVVLIIAGRYLSNVSIPVLQPRGEVGIKEKNLMVFAVILSATVVIPVFIMLIGISWKYRESNTKSTYSPNFDHSRLAETIWWIVPTILITILSVVTWNSSHTLDPYRPLVSNIKPLTIQAVSLDWKWLFIYPDQHIASVNYLKFPANTPINFQITSDSVMNSFWIPQLGGQIYAMPGMNTQLHLKADQSGLFYGSSANISGSGFAGMNFMANATSQADFNQWQQLLNGSSKDLSIAQYEKLARPSSNNQVAYYTVNNNNLYDTILSKYMGHGSSMSMMNKGGL